MEKCRRKKPFFRPQKFTVEIFVQVRDSTCIKIFFSTCILWFISFNIQIEFISSSSAKHIISFFNLKKELSWQFLLLLFVLLKLWERFSKWKSEVTNKTTDKQNNSYYIPHIFHCFKRIRFKWNQGHNCRKRKNLYRWLQYFCHLIMTSNVRLSRLLMRLTLQNSIYTLWSDVEGFSGSTVKCYSQLSCLYEVAILELVSGLEIFRLIRFIKFETDYSRI